MTSRQLKRDVAAFWKKDVQERRLYAEAEGRELLGLVAGAAPRILDSGLTAWKRRELSKTKVAFMGRERIA